MFGKADMIDRIRKFFVICCLISTLAGAALAETREAFPRNWLAEFDITFWQTAPLAVFWSYAVALQLSQGGAINWSPVINCSALISLANAGWHAGHRPDGQAEGGNKISPVL